MACRRTSDKPLLERMMTQLISAQMGYVAEWNGQCSWLDHYPNHKDIVATLSYQWKLLCRNMCARTLLRLSTTISCTFCRTNPYELFKSHVTYRQIANKSRTKSQNLNVCRLVLQLPLPTPLEPGILSREWRCSWSNADRRCSNYIWMIRNSLPIKVRLVLEIWRQSLLSVSPCNVP